MIKTYADLVKNEHELVKLARETRMKYEVFITIRDVDHYLKIVYKIVKDVSKDINEWGFTNIVIHELRDTRPVVTSMMIFKDMPDSFDPVSFGNELTNLE